ncbi:MAG TPA: uroporphyrinogen-III C-methyltransferase [Candidatus Nitrosotalea sp.]|nr:uroporphyrinogen-III C-methyltransferase [Candidatus Nitrosotalea sp.]
MDYYPVFLDLRGQRCVVLGADELARQKSAGLVSAGALVERREVYRPGELGGVRLVIDASGDEEVNRLVFSECERLGILVNVLDRPQRCRFIAPAVVDRAPLLMAISTSGESPHLAGALRARLEAQFGPEWGPFTALIGRVRRGLRARGVPAAQQLAIYRRLLRSGVRRRLAEGGSEAGARAAREVVRAVAGAGRVALVGAGPGDVGLLTLAAQDLLSAADVVFHDALVSPAVLALAGGAELVDVGKRGGRPSPDQASITAALIKAARQGREVVRLKGGDPFVFGRGAEEALALAQAGLEVLVVPGISSALAAPLSAHIPLTLRGLSSSFAVATAQVGCGSGPGLEELAKAVDTLVLLMPLSGLGATLERLLRVLEPRRPAAAVFSASTPEQAVLRAPLSELATRVAQSGLKGPAVVVVGEVVNALVPASELLGSALGSAGDVDRDAVVPARP